MCVTFYWKPSYSSKSTTKMCVTLNIIAEIRQAGCLNNKYIFSQHVLWLKILIVEKYNVHCLLKWPLYSDSCVDFSKLEMNLTIFLLFTLIIFGIVAFAHLKSSEGGKNNILNLSSVDETKIIRLLSIS